MEVVDIFKESLLYPLNNIALLLIFIVLGVIAGVVVGGTITSIIFSVAEQNIVSIIGSVILGIVIFSIILFIIAGYELDIIKLGIIKDSNTPGIDIYRQFINGVKSFIVCIVYYIIPVIIGSILAIIFQHWLSGIISFIISVVFSLAAIMAQCRLAKTENVFNALSFGEAIADISRVGIINLILLVVFSAVIVVIMCVIAYLFLQWNAIAGGIIIGILGVYFSFVISRASGLLYSNV